MRSRALATAVFAATWVLLALWLASPVARFIQRASTTVTVNRSDAWGIMGMAVGIAYSILVITQQSSRRWKWFFAALAWAVAFVLAANGVWSLFHAPEEVVYNGSLSNIIVALAYIVPIGGPMTWLYTGYREPIMRSPDFRW